MTDPDTPVPGVPTGQNGWRLLAHEQPPITKLQWIEALESGEYEQYHGELVDDRTEPKCTCCIGVAVRLKKLSFFFYHEAGSRHGDFQIPLEQRVSSVSTGMAAPLIEGFTHEDQRMAVRLNDEIKLSFPLIAAAFRERWNLPRTTPDAP